MRHLVAAGGARATRIAIESAGTGDWHVGRRRATSAAGRSARRAASRCRARRASSSPADFDALRPRAGDGPREPRRAAEAGAATPQTAPRSRCCARSTPTRAAPTPRCPTRTTAAPRGFDEVFDICEAACRGLPARSCAREARGCDADGARLAAALARGAGHARSRDRAACGGGDINDAYAGHAGRRARAVREDQRPLAARRCSPPRRAGLRLARRGARAAHPRGGRGVGARATRRSSWCWSWSARARRRATSTSALGRGLAALHRFGAPGLRPRPRQLHRPPAAGERPGVRPGSWPVFYRERRLEPQLRLAADDGLAHRRGCGGGSSGCSRRCDELVRPARAAGAPARRSVGRQPAVRRRRRAVPDRSGGLRRPPRDRSRDDAALRRVRRAGLRRLRRGLAARRRARGARRRSTSSTR